MLADDDSDDRYFFDKALKCPPIKATLTMVDDGEKLLSYLKENTDKLPDVLFLDLNMPRKNGDECLREIKSNEKLQHLPVVIYSTSLHEQVADTLYQNGAQFYVKKTDTIELEKVLTHIFKLIEKNLFARPTRKQFVLNVQNSTY